MSRIYSIFKLYIMELDCLIKWCVEALTDTQHKILHVLLFGITLINQASVYLFNRK